MELVLENVSKSFGGLRAVGGVGFTVKSDAIFGLIGPNGAGKTTVFNLITGVYKPDEGVIRFGSKDLVPLKPAQIAGVGVGRTFQNIRLFGQLTVIENLLVACELQKKAHLAAAVLRAPVHYEDEAAMTDRALELLRVFDLHEMADEAPTALSYGNQRRLEIARAMMLKPALLLLDEPAAGMNYGEAEGLKTQIQWLRDTFKLAIVLVEHNMQVVMGVCEEIHVLDHGETIAHGTPDEIRVDPKVLAAYLGEDENAPSVLSKVVERSQRDVARLSDPESDRLVESAGQKLSEPEAKALSDNLMRAMELGLKEPDLPEFKRDEGWELFEDGEIPAPPDAPKTTAAPPPRPPPPPPRSSKRIEAVTPAKKDETSQPDVGKIDAAWGSEPKLPDDKSEGAGAATAGAKRPPSSGALVASRGPGGGAPKPGEPKK